MKYKQLLRGMLASGFLLMGIQAEAKTVQVTLHAVETDVAYDNKGSTYRAWTFDGKVPGPVVRVTEGIRWNLPSSMTK